MITIIMIIIITIITIIITATIIVIVIIIMICKKINRLEIVLKPHYTILLTCTSIIPPIENLFVIICENLFFLLGSFFYENKQAYEYHRLKQIFSHQKQIMIFF